MDGDLQHPPEMVPVLLRTAEEQHADLVVATRRSVNSEVTGLNLARDLISEGWTSSHVSSSHVNCTV